MVTFTEPNSFYDIVSCLLLLADKYNEHIK